MIFYRAVRRVARIALRWYYADLTVRGGEQLPMEEPVLLVANHPNALIDAMVMVVIVRRRVLLTAKATLFEQPLLAALLRAFGVVPLRRAKDEQALTATASAVARNADAFQAVTSALAQGGVVLVFPEGISHDAPALAPLRTGAARMALQAHAAGVTGLSVVAAGLTYEAKERPRSRIIARLDEPLALDAWLAAHAADATTLTRELEARLRRVTLNFASEGRAREVMQLARTLDALAAPVPPLAKPRPMEPETDLARRVEEASQALASASADIVQRANALIAATDAFAQRLAARGVTLSELRVSPAIAPGVWFVLREALVLSLALPVVAVDRLAHDIPVRVARWLVRRSLVTDPSRDQPAMRTILVGAGLLLVWYLAIGALLVHWLGWTIATLVLATTALCASADLSMRDRLARAWRRARTYLALRGDPAFRVEALAEADRLLEEATRLESELQGATGPRGAGRP